MPAVGHSGDLQEGEGRRAGNDLILVRVPVGAPFNPLAHPTLRRRDGLIPSVASPRKGPLLPSMSVGWGLYPQLGAKVRGWGKTSQLGLLPQRRGGLGANGRDKGAFYPAAGVQVRSACPRTHALTLLHLLPGSPHFCTSLWGGRGDHRTLQASLLWFQRGGHLSFLLFQLSGEQLGNV